MSATSEWRGENAWWREPTRAQWCAFGAAWVGWVLDAFDFTIFMLVMPQIAKSFGASHIATAGSLTLTLFARLIGGFFAGAAADRWGRRLPLLISIVWFALCDGAVALAPSFTWILVLRTLFGFGMGAEWTSGTTLAMESWPTRSRGIASGVLQGSWAIGYLFAAIVSAYVLPRWGWRALFVCAAAPALLVLPMRFFIQESREWSRARAVVKARVTLDAKMIGKLAWAISAMGLGFGAYYALAGLYPTLLQVDFGADASSIARLVGLFNVGMLVGSIACGALAAKRGTTIAIALPALGALVALPFYIGIFPGFLPVGAFLGGALGVGFCGVVPMLLTDMFDAESRARFVGVVYHAGAALAALVPPATAAFAAWAHVRIGVAVGLIAGACELALAIVVLARRGALMNRRVSRVSLSFLGLLAVLFGTASCADAPNAAPPAEHVASQSSSVAALTQVSTFGANPGNLLMYTYAPAGMPSNAPLVLALHGCTETASAYEDAGWNDLADQNKFYVLYPQQQSANNLESCFNWFGNTSNSTVDITRDQGEAASIKQMIDTMKSTYSIDSSRVYATGFSAGAAYAVALLAMYPDVFAAGASFSGVPWGCATTYTGAFTCMDGAVTKAPADWATLVKGAYPGYTGPYPRISVWQGSMDTTVNTANLGEIVQQWTAVTGVSQTATSTSTVGSATHSEYADSSGVVQVESYSVSGMAHAVAIDPSSNCGTADTYAVDEKVCAVGLAAHFFGIGGASSSSSSSSGSTSSSSSSSSGASSSGSSSGTSSGGSSSGSSGGSSGASSGGGSSGAGADGGAGGTADIPGCSASPMHASNGAAPFAFVAMAVGMILRRSRSSRAKTSAKKSVVMRALITLIALFLTLIVTHRANATETIELDDPKPAEPVNADSATQKKPAKDYLGAQGTFFTGAAVSTTPAVLFGYFPVDHLATTLGLGFTYNANGTPTSPLTDVKGGTNNRIGSDLFLDVIYFVHDKAPFAMGPELNFIGSLSPNVPFTAVVVTPLWALRYAPWKAPVAIGTGLGCSFAFVQGAKPVVSLATQGLDIVYAF